MAGGGRADFGVNRREFVRSSIALSAGTLLGKGLLAQLASRPGTVVAGAPGNIVERPFGPRPARTGKTLFATLPPDATGIVTANPYDDPRMWGSRYLEFTTGAIGTGVAIGDYDNDGRPDLFVINKVGHNKLFRNLGGWKFEDVTEKAGVAGPADAWSQGVTFVDINNDGLLDIYICRFAAPNLLYVNQGDGTFREMAQSYGLDVVDACNVAAFCDYDRDGLLDVFIQTNLLDSSKSPNGQKNYLFHNNGNGTFTNVTARAGIDGVAQGHSAVWWDYDNDGWPDLYVANDFDPPDLLYHNNGDGTFTDTLDGVLPHTPHSSMGSDFGDVNNDGLIDFLALDMASSTHEKDQRGMAASRDRNPNDEAQPATPPQLLRNALYINTGTGVCQEAAFLAGVAKADWAWGPRFEDMDNDGRLDLFVANGTIRDLTNRDILARTLRTESHAERVQIWIDSPVLADRNLAFRNLGDLAFEDVSEAWGLNQAGPSFGAAFGDFGGDGNLDLVVSNYQRGVTFLRNECETGHRVIVALRGTASNRFGVDSLVRIESASGVQVRKLVLARGYLSNSEPVLHFGLGDDARIDRLTVHWPSGFVQSFQDLGVDRHFTITEPSGTPPPIPPPRPAGWRSNSGQFGDISEASGLSLTLREEIIDEVSQEPLLAMRHSRRGPGVAVGDLQGSGQDAVCLGGTTQDPARILARSGPGSFGPLDTSSWLPVGSVDDGPILIFDANGDGLNDLLVTKGGAGLPDGAPDYQPKLYLNQGGGSFLPAADNALPPFATSTGAAVAADWDGSGRLGLFLGGRLLPGQYPLPPRSALLANRGGTFEDVTDSVAPALRSVGMVTSALWSDVDGDGWPDLLVTVEWGGVKYFHNNQGKTLEDWTDRSGFSSAGTGWWSSIAAADFNGDGRMDYVVGNVGLNTQYEAGPDVLFYGDFNGDGGAQMVEACYDKGRLVPWRSSLMLGASMPWILKRYPSNDDFARATLSEIFGDDKLAAAKRFEATELRSGVLMSRPDGTHRFEPLPRIAQIAPIFGLAAGDLDGDGRADIYAVQNSYSPIPSIGRFDGGLSQLLRGDGRGGLTPVVPAASGLVVPRDAKGLAVLDIDQDGWPDFLISRNNAPSMAFQNRRVAGRRSVCVRLRGAASNPSAVGARLTAELADGYIQTGEIHAGSGYFSQSAAACFFGSPDSNPILRIRVRWPSAGFPVTVHEVPPQATTLSLSAPSQPAQT